MRPAMTLQATALVTEALRALVRTRLNRPWDWAEGPGEVAVGITAAHFFFRRSRRGDAWRLNPSSNRARPIVCRLKPWPAAAAPEALSVDLPNRRIFRRRPRAGRRPPGAEALAEEDPPVPSWSKRVHRL